MNQVLNCTIVTSPNLQKSINRILLMLFTCSIMTLGYGQSLHITPSFNEYIVGDQFTVAVTAESGSSQVRSVQANISFDPSIIQVVGITDQTDFPNKAPLPPNTSEFDNTTGQILVGRLTAFGTQASGTLDIMDVTFEVIADAGAGSDIAFQFSNDSRTTSLLLTNVNTDLLQNGNVNDAIVATPVADVDISVTSSSSSVVVGNSFTAEILINSEAPQEIDYADIVITFDPSVIQVASNPVPDNSSLQPFISPSYDNTAGTISYTGGSFTPATGDFNILQIPFNAIALNPNTTIGFSTNSVQRSGEELINDIPNDVFPLNIAVTMVDSDGDGIEDINDNCVSTPNPNQEDNDGDNIGDVCDPDDDNDGCDDIVDADPLVANLMDSDNDGSNDDCDLCQGDDSFGDSDNDGLCDESTSISGVVTLQGRPLAPNAQWAVGALVEILMPGSAVSALPPTSVSLNQSGNFSIQNIPMGTYDIAIKNRHTLRNLVANVTTTYPVTTIDFGILKEGDATDNNQINASDYTAFITAYGSTSTDAAYDNGKADFNEDGVIDILDFSLMSFNYNQTGDFTAAAREEQVELSKPNNSIIKTAKVDGDNIRVAFTESIGPNLNLQIKDDSGRVQTHNLDQGIKSTVITLMSPNISKGTYELILAEDESQQILETHTLDQ